MRRFERLPEMQLHQVTLSSQMWQLKQEWLRAGKTWPNFTALEGPAISPAMRGGLTPQQEAYHTVRAFLILAAYGCTRHLGCPALFSCAGAWGETQGGRRAKVYRLTKEGRTQLAEEKKSWARVAAAIQQVLEMP